MPISRNPSKLISLERARTSEWSVRDYSTYISSTMNVNDHLWTCQYRILYTNVAIQWDTLVSWEKRGTKTCYSCSFQHAWAGMHGEDYARIRRKSIVRQTPKEADAKLLWRYEKILTRASSISSKVSKLRRRCVWELKCRFLATWIFHSWLQYLWIGKKFDKFDALLIFCSAY